MATMEYRSWFAEAANDPHPSFTPVLSACRATADNTATLADLNLSWSEDEEEGSWNCTKPLA